MSERVSAAAQQAAVPTQTLYPPRHGGSKHNHHQHDHHSHCQAQTDQFQGPHEHTERAMADFTRQMMELADKNTPKSRKEAYDIAHMLLRRAELPLESRVRAHIVLGCGRVAYLHHAQEAVRFAEMGREIYGPGKTPESQAALEDLLWEARETLRRAERDMEELRDIDARIEAGELTVKKGDTLVYGNKNGMSNSYQ